MKKRVRQLHNLFHVFKCLYKNIVSFTLFFYEVLRMENKMKLR